MAALILKEYKKCPDIPGLKKVHVFMEVNNNILEERHVYIGWHNSPEFQQQIHLTGLGNYAFYPQMVSRMSSAIAGLRVSIQLGKFDYDTRKQIARLARDMTKDFSLTGEDGNCQAWLQRLLRLISQNGIITSELYDEYTIFIKTDNASLIKAEQQKLDAAYPHNDIRGRSLIVAPARQAETVGGGRKVVLDDISLSIEDLTSIVAIVITEYCDVALESVLDLEHEGAWVHIAVTVFKVTPSLSGSFRTQVDFITAVAIFICFENPALAPVGSVARAKSSVGSSAPALGSSSSQAKNGQGSSKNDLHVDDRVAIGYIEIL
ncbi:hypothetical protein BGZ49_007796 [Haplosporangium sp. Z 27]|nr:hypothetical protein BGZ49_007796 [Haplosporangium sp. Z 27]